MKVARRRRGVSAIISALMMVSIAVSLSAALFVSTTGYLSSLTNALGSTQPRQNRAAQSILTIESYVAKSYTTGFASSPTNGYVLLYVRNVGTVSLVLGSVAVTAPPTNAGQTESFSSVLTTVNSTDGTWSTPYTGVHVCSESTSQSYCEGTDACQASVAGVSNLSTEANTARLWIEWCSGASPRPSPGDAFQIQVTSTAGASNIITINTP